MRAGAWGRALEAWNEVSTRFGESSKFSWLSARVRVLLALGRLDEAQHACGSLAANFPEKPAGLLGLAEIAMRRRQWSEARTYWTELLRRFNDQTAGPWGAGLATALIELGCLSEAEEVYRALTLRFEADPTGFVGLAQMAMRSHRWLEARTRWEEVLRRFGKAAPAFTTLVVKGLASPELLMEVDITAIGKGDRR